jgi:hypothetical protein
MLRHFLNLKTQFVYMEVIFGPLALFSFFFFKTEIQYYSSQYVGGTFLLVVH